MAATDANDDIRPKRINPKKQRKPAPTAPIRIIDDFTFVRDLANESDSISHLRPMCKSALRWTALILPSGEPFKESAFRIRIELPRDYPQSPPKIKFLTKFFHPNVSVTGEMKIDILTPEKWNPTMRVSDAMEMILDMVDNPKVDKALIANDDAANLFTKKRADYDKKAAEEAKKNGIQRPVLKCRELKREDK